MSLGNLSNLQNLSRRAKGAKEVIVLSCDEVIPKEGQVRKEFTGIEELADSIQTHGLEQPIIVSPKDASGKYRIQKGERRWRACKLRGLPIEAIINKKEQSSLDETAGELIENIQRENLAPLEIAEGLNKFIEAGWKAAAVAKRLGKSRGYVSTHLALLRLPHKIQRLYEEGVTRDTETLNNLRQLYERDPDEAEEVCDRALVTGISRKASRDLLKEAKQSKKEAFDEHSGDSIHSMEHLSGTGMSSDAIGKGETEKLEYSNVSDHQETDSSKRKVEDTRNEIDDPEPPANARPKAKNRGLEKWKRTEPQRVRIKVSTVYQDVFRTGLLLTDRVDTTAGFCWIRLDDNEGSTPEVVRMSVSDLQLMSVDGED
ncbi:ParB/RepB/Spo0J family partition protein [Halomonas sp. McH1-25]|uniref:ParB/RepB/Spo0J family partition protein n=1 Tax=unclassified Halomonas TaxID=2609666 RepID=UPI001EF5F7AF|nr:MULTISPECIES: ParB/RepB/Spo0J family partition protein [unclassified Halomonas]MCG7602052.1 ParB/RepB/Spo0J family partition protein [Halomonas sp. McH1-25]MCP1342888.1 ParB/RepB/Spo0J family partition protein [Halomonas sp. FL8]MCP1361673.1 ParB/RepB/Spo0J family partition protein [Halomonas sp. BBD45]MCP1363630.1 ParB/RepB/Spo0J family partition protein [Halomonas sp. BBD48]